LISSRDYFDALEGGAVQQDVVGVDNDGESGVGSKAKSKWGNK